MHNSNDDFPLLNNPNVDAKPINKPTEITFKHKHQNTYAKSASRIIRNKQTFPQIKTKFRYNHI